MKKINLTLIIMLFVSGLTYANNYEKAMTEAIQELYACSNLQDYRKASAKFERIGAAEDKEWLPFYYAGLSYIWASHTTQVLKEMNELLDKAQLFVDKAEKLSPNNDEIITLQGYIYMMKVSADPATMGPQLIGVAIQTFGKAVGINENNPRALMMMGRMQMGTDQFFGNDTSASCAMISKAVQMFDNQKSESPLAPMWGKEVAQGFLSECNAN